MPKRWLCIVFALLIISGCGDDGSGSETAPDDPREETDGQNDDNEDDQTDGDNDGTDGGIEDGENEDDQTDGGSDGTDGGTEDGQTDGNDGENGETDGTATAPATVVNCEDREAAVTVEAVDNRNFDPESVEIETDEVVRFEFVGGADHTVTNRPFDDIANEAALYDEELTPSSGPICIEFSTSGDHNYFCRPHESLGMEGTVTVQ